MFRPSPARVFSVLAIATLTITDVQGQTKWFVDVGDVKCSETGGTQAGPPLCRIQRAIELSLPGDEIVVARGTYNELINFIGKGVTVRSSGGPAVTRIDAGPIVDPGTGKPVVRCDSGEGPDSVLDGFTLTGGTGQATKSGDFLGGGMYIFDGSPTVMNCVFSGNTATHGGGMFGSGGGLTVIGSRFAGNTAVGNGGGIEARNLSRASITDCTFDGNSAVNGGGIRDDHSDAVVTRCTFSGNSASGRGGGIYSTHSNQAVTNCMFDNNSSVFEGGGMYNTLSNPIVTSTAFIGNTTTGSTGDGAGMYNSESSPTVTNCIFSGNRASGTGADGGGLFSIGNSNPTVRNSTFAGNFAFSRGGGIANLSGIMILRNCILRDNKTHPSSAWNAPQIYNGSITITKFSNIEGSFVNSIWQGSTFGTDGGGNINATPLFVDEDGADGIVGTLDDDLRLAAGSPAIDAGFSLGTPLDLDGHIRIVDDPDTPDTGVGFPAVIDMGAYEFGADAPTGNPDVDLDGDVDLFDFALMQAAFNGPPFLPAPVCGNGDLEFGEACDDGNIAPGDGCDENCMIESPTNDNCVDAILVFDGDTPFNNISATLDGPAVSADCDPIDGTTQIPADVWFRYVATCTGTVEVSLCDSDDYDTKLAVYDGLGCPPTAQALACSDDDCGAFSLDSSLTFSAVQGREYAIRIGGFTVNSQGTGTIAIRCD